MYQNNFPISLSVQKLDLRTTYNILPYDCMIVYLIIFLLLDIFITSTRSLWPYLLLFSLDKCLSKITDLGL